MFECAGISNASVLIHFATSCACCPLNKDDDDFYFRINIDCVLWQFIDICVLPYSKVSGTMKNFLGFSGIHRY